MCDVVTRKPKKNNGAKNAGREEGKLVAKIAIEKSALYRQLDNTSVPWIIYSRGYGDSFLSFSLFLFRSPSDLRGAAQRILRARKRRVMCENALLFHFDLSELNESPAH